MTATKRMGVVGILAALLNLGWWVATDLPGAHAANLSATVVRTTDTWRFNPPSPDPSGITYLPGSGRLLISDGEVEEMSIYAGKNLFEVTRTGTLAATGTTTAYSREPVGLSLNPSTNRLYVSDDDQMRVFTVAPGNDGRFGTSDDTGTSFSTSAVGNTDPEGVDVDTSNGELYTIDGLGAEVYRYSASGTMLSHFDVGVFGARDPEGIAYDQAQDRLFVLDQTSQAIYDVTRAGALVNVISITAAHAVKAAGLTTAPASNGSGATNFYIVDRGVDNDVNPLENDGKLYEMAAGLTVGTRILDAAVAAGSDDAEEHSNGSVTLNSGDLELTTDRSVVQTVGLRFAAVGVPRGATIQRASVQFQVDEVSTGTAPLTLAAEATGNAATFTTTARNVSSRPRTTPGVSWTPADWTSVGARGPAQQTTDLASTLQQVVNLPGWNSGNAVALIVTGTGRRTAEALEGKAPPVLHIEYREGPVVNTPPSVNAGPDQSVLLTTGAILSGVVTDDGLPDPPGSVTRGWVKVSGPDGDVTFADPAAASTAATFPAAGVYVLRLTAGDSALTSSDDVTITVAEPVPDTDPPTVGIRRETSATVVNTTATSTVAIARPAGTVPGDVLVACLAVNGSTVAATGVPAGWAPVASVTSITNPRLYGYYRVAGGSEPATYAWTLSTAVASGAGITRYSGVNTTTPLDTAPRTAAGAAATTGTVPGLTTATASAMVVGCMAVNSGNTGVTIASPVGLAESWDVGGKRVELADGPQTSPGASGDKVWTFSASREWAGWLAALRPQ